MRVVSVCIGNKNVQVERREESLFEKLETPGSKLDLLGNPKKDPLALAKELKNKVGQLTPDDLARLKEEGKSFWLRTDQK